MRKAALFLLVLALLLSACVSAADVAGRNISRDADQFKVERRIVFYNGITGDYILVIQGKCSLGNDVWGELSVTCKVGEDKYKKHFLGLSDNVTYFAEQVESSDADPYHYQVYFRPETILPDIQLDISE